MALDGAGGGPREHSADHGDPAQEGPTRLRNEVQPMCSTFLIETKKGIKIDSAAVQLAPKKKQKQ